MRRASLLAVTTAVIAGVWPATAFAATQPRLGTALNFTVLAGSAITNTGPSVITGNLGLSPGTASSLTGFPPGTVTGAQHTGTDAVGLQAKNDLITAYTDAASAKTTSDLTGKDLGGKNLTPGVYTFSSSAQLTGPLTLSGKGVFIFRIGSTLTTASSSTVLLRNGAQACSVWWQVGSSATLGSATQFQGNLMALTSITIFLLRPLIDNVLHAHVADLLALGTFLVLGGIAAGVLSFALVAILFLITRFSFGYVLGFYFYTMILGV